jgi:hypothetical protein
MLGRAQCTLRQSRMSPRDGAPVPSPGLVVDPYCRPPPSQFLTVLDPTPSYACIHLEHHATIDEVARMINVWFTGVTNDIGEVKQDMAEAKHRLGRIEHLLLAEQKREIEDLKERMKKLEGGLAV